jgi:hypothetical protein
LAATAKTQRRRAQRKPAVWSAIQIETSGGMDRPRWVTADVVDLIDGVIDGGCGLKLATPLKSGSDVVIRGKLGEGRTAEYLKAAVRWCIKKPDGTFRAGLTFADRPAYSDRPTDSIHSDSPDLYEVMQLSSSADAGTISRVYRWLASRYHPDNVETGNSELFIRLSEAYRILSDPEKRASYDAHRRAANRIEHSRPATGALGGWAAALQRL